MLARISEIIGSAASMLWGAGAPFLFIATGIYLSIRTRFIELRRLFPAIRNAFRGGGRSDGEGIAPNKALLTSLGAVMGPGNIIGVSAAVTFGGAGAVFWLWITGFVGMSLRFAESSSSVLFNRGGREGMMAVIRAKEGKLPALLFALTGAITAVVMADMTSSGVLALSLGESHGIARICTGIAVALISGFVISGGGKRITDSVPWLVLIVTISYFAASLVIFAMAPGECAAALSKIFSSAFELRAGISGLLFGAIRHGISKGIYSNECGIGSEPTLASATTNDDPRTQGELSMLNPFVDTVLFCGISGIICVMGLSYSDAGEMGGSGLIASVFNRFFPRFGELYISVILALLVLATVISWYYYGEVFIGYLFPGKKAAQRLYRALYIIAPLGSVYLPLRFLMDICDISIALMAFPSLAALITSAKEIGRIARGSKPPDVEAAVDIENLTG